jgi:hypothetical protein
MRASAISLAAYRPNLFLVGPLSPYKDPFMARAKAPARRPLVRVEQLEDRLAPALFTQLTPQTSTQLANNGFVAAGDWNKDGFQDIVMTNYGNGTLLGVTPGKTITFAYGNGTGSFGSFSSQAVGAGNDLVSFLAVGDLNNDGNPDMVTANTDNTNENGTMTVFLGSAAGAFTKTGASPISSGGSRASWVGIADFNKDGNMDVAVVNLGEQGSGAAGGRTIALYKGDGTGNLQPFLSIAIPDANGVATAGAIADFDGDTWPDLAVSFANVPPDDVSPQVPGSVRVFMNKQDGTLQDFASASEYDSGGPLPISIVAGDFSGDGKVDLVVANAGDPDANGLYAQFGLGHSIGTMTNGGSGTFGPTIAYTAGFSSAFAVALADLNLDGKLDIAVCDIGKPGSLLGGGAVAGGITIYLGKADTGFSLDPTSPYSSPGDAPQYLAIGSFNSNTDTTPDVVLVHESNKIVTYLNTTTPAATTTTSIAITPTSPATFGTEITITATVGTATGTPTGTVTFFNGATVIGTGTLSTVGGEQVATLKSSTWNAGNYSFSARYEGAGGFASSKSGNTAFVIDKAVTTTGLTVNPDSANFGSNITFTATVSSTAGTPTGTVAFFDNGVQIGTGTIATVLGQQQATFSTTALAIGTHPITAQYTGAVNFATSVSGEKTVTINSAAPANTTTTLASSQNPSLFGQSVTFTATVTATAGTPGGLVTFSDNGVQIGSGTLANVGGQMQATFTTSLSMGSHPIVATYTGATGFNASTSATLTQQVNATPTTTTIVSGPGGGPYAFESNVTFTATVAATAGIPNGSVSFFDNGVQIGGPVGLVNVGGQMQAAFTTSALAVGGHPITAKFLGSTGQDPSESSPLSVTISSVATTATLFTSLNPSTLGQSVTLTAKVAPNATVTPVPTGTVEFRIGTTVIGTGTLSTVAGVQTATLTTSTLPIGDSIITAVYPGDATFGSSTSGGLTQTVDLPAAGLIGYREFGAGAGAGLDDSAKFFNPDGTLRFTANVFGGFAGGVRVASADFNSDGIADLVLGTGPGAASKVVVMDGSTKTVLFTVAPFEASFTGGVFVSAGDITGDGVAELVITPDEGGGPRARVFTGVGFTQIADFFGIDDPAFRGGARSAIADVTGDGKSELLIAAGFGGGPRVAVYDGTTLTTTRSKPFPDFFVFEQTLRNGVYIAGGDLNGDGFAEVIAGGGPGGGPRIFALSGKDLVNSGGATKTQLANFFAGDTNNRGGIRLVVRNLDGDDRADIVTGSGVGAGTRVTGYLGKNIPINGTPINEFAFDAFPGFSGGVFVG